MDYFLSFYHTNNPKNKNFEKREKNPGDTIILHMCLINDRSFSHFGPFFTHDPLNNLKNQNFEKMKKTKNKKKTKKKTNKQKHLEKLPCVPYMNII